MKIDVQPKKNRFTALLGHLSEYAIYALLVAAGMLIILGFVNANISLGQRQSIDEQVAATKDLVSQVKSLSEENKRLSQTAANYAHCNAVILALYTQTGDPIKVEDLDKCKVTSYPSDNNSSTQTLPNPGTTNSSDSNGTGQQQSNTGAGGNVATQPSSSAPSGTGSGGSTNPGSGSGGSSPSNPSQPPTPQRTAPILSIAPSPLLPGLTIYPICVDGRPLLAVGCR